MQWLAATVATSFFILGQARADGDLTNAARSPYDLERFFETNAALETAPLWDALGVHEQDRPLTDWTDSRDARTCASELIVIAAPNQAIVVLSQTDHLFTARCSRGGTMGRLYSTLPNPPHPRRRFTSCMKTLTTFCRTPLCSITWPI
jgi:hypothetical protein